MAPLYMISPKLSKTKLSAKNTVISDPKTPIKLPSKIVIFLPTKSETVLKQKHIIAPTKNIRP